MTYQTKVFSKGEILTHDHMNNIITGIDELKNQASNNNASSISLE